MDWLLRSTSRRESDPRGVKTHLCPAERVHFPILKVKTVFPPRDTQQSPTALHQRVLMRGTVFVHNMEEGVSLLDFEARHACVCVRKIAVPKRGGSNGLRRKIG